ncbi:MAG: putative ABC transport system substrate-binding protein [Nitrospirae bacterium]|nr:MAG: putative ABC transport system substrate-binding protein [Nitrospirota bacterium]
MKSFSTELKVGAFSLVILTLLTYMTFKVGGFEWVKKKGYVLYAEFKNIGGLDEKTRIKVAGVDAGTIEKIQLKDGKARLVIRVNRDVVLYSDASVGIKATGLLGDKYLEIKTGLTKPELKDGDTIKNVQEVIDIDDLVRNLSGVSSNISTLASALSESLGTPEAKKALKESILNIKDITAGLKETIAVNDHKMRTTLDNINNLITSINDLVEKNKEPLTTTVSNIKDFSASLKTEGPDLVANLNKAAKELKEMVEENRPTIKNAAQSIDNISKTIAQGEGTLGKLVKDDRLYESVNKAAEGVNKSISAIDRFRTFITFQTDYLTRPKDAKGYFYVTLQPRPDKYYILGIVSDPVGSVTTTTTTTNGVTVKEEKVEQKIEFTAQFAKRFNNAALRAGLTESTFGAGADYFLFNDKAKVSVDVWDFSNNEDEAKNPHAKVGVDYFIFKNVFLSAGADNIFNKKRRGAYVGAGLKFEDEDVKYLFGTIPKIPGR